MRLRNLAWLVIAGTLVGGLVAPSTALADAFPGNADTTIADSSLHTYCYASNFDVDQSIGSYAMAVLDSTTDMSDSFVAGNCTNWDIDVWWWESNLEPGIRGMRRCILYYSSDVCNSSDLLLDIAALDVGGDDWYDRRKTAVHELGHSIGLNHDNVSAMRSGEIPSTALQWRRYSAHDIGHINATY